MDRRRQCQLLLDVAALSVEGEGYTFVQVTPARGCDPSLGEPGRGQPASTCLAMTMRWISLVPSPISHSFTSRRWRSTSNSRTYPYPPCTCRALLHARVAASLA